jgi:hypothetical protein
MKGMLYFKRSGAIFAEMTIGGSANIHQYEDADRGFLPLIADPSAVFVDAAALEPRIDSGPIIADLLSVDVGDTITLSGLPDPCFLQIDRNVPFEVTGGSHAISFATPRAATINLVGQYRAAPLLLTWADLEDLKNGLRASARDVRDAKINGGCMTPKGAVDTDLESRLNISDWCSAAMRAQSASESFSIDWTMQDNSVATHDADEMIAMATTVIAFVSACHAAYQAIRGAIEATTDAATLNAIDISEGYP